MSNYLSVCAKNLVQDTQLGQDLLGHFPDSTPFCLSALEDFMTLLDYLQTPGTKDIVFSDQ